MRICKALLFFLFVIILTYIIYAGEGYLDIVSPGDNSDTPQKKTTSETTQDKADTKNNVKCNPEYLAWFDYNGDNVIGEEDIRIIDSLINKADEEDVIKLRSNKQVLSECLSTPVSSLELRCKCPDVNNDGLVNVFDLVTIGNNLGSVNEDFDIYSDGKIDLPDLNCVSINFGERSNEIEECREDSNIKQSPQLIIGRETEFIGEDQISIDNLNYNSRGYLRKESGEIIRMYGERDIDYKEDSYIIEFKEMPVLVKKTHLEKEAKENEEGIIKPIFNRIVASVLPTELEPALSNNIDEKIKIHKYNVELKHDRFKRDISKLRKENKITGYVTKDGKENDENLILDEYKNVFNGITLGITSDDVDELKKIEYVKEVHPNIEVKVVLQESVPLVSADKVWNLDKEGNNCKETGKECLTGKGIKIAIIDTGVDYSHPDLGGTPINERKIMFNEKVVGGYDFVNNDDVPMDDEGHGTHVAATAGGNGVLKGIAPDSEIYAFKVLDKYGRGRSSNIIAAIEKSTDLDNDGVPAEDNNDKVDIISMSLGGRGHPDDPLSLAVDNAVDAGVSVVVAGGNSGPAKYTIGSPGTARRAITVGASDKMDKIADFSSRGPVVWENGVLMKPDVSAPGVGICAARWDGAYPDAYTNCNNDDNHVAISGTSMATPIVTGAVALIKQAHPDWTPYEIKYTIRTTAEDIMEPFTSQGMGRINILRAIQLNTPPPIAQIYLKDYNHNEKKIVIGGTASGRLFDYYKLYYGYGDSPEKWSLIYSSNNKIENDEIYVWNYGNLVGEITLKLEVYNSNKQVSIDYLLIEINDPAFLELVNLNKPIIHNSIVIGDMDNDGKKEIGVATSYLYSYGGGLGLYLLNNNGRLIRGYPKDIDFIYFLTGRIIISSPTMADINNDGFKEIIISSGEDSDITAGKVYAFDKNGAEIVEPFNVKEFYEEKCGLFEEGKCGFYVEMISNSIGDIDNDGFYNILAHNRGMFFTTPPNDEKIREKHLFVLDEGLKPVSIINTKNLQNTPPAIADIDNDGINEIIFSGFNCDDTLSSCGINLGGKVDVMSIKKSSVVWSKTTPEGFIEAPVVGDIDGDGMDEIVAGTYNLVDRNSYHIYAWNHDGSKVNGFPIQDTNHLFSDNLISLGDLDNDNIPEIIGITTNGFLYVYKGDGTKFIEPIKIEERLRKHQPIVADVNNDNIPEILFLGKSRVYVKKADGSDLPGWPKFVSNAKGIVVDDIDSDNKLDLIVFSDYGRILKYTFIEGYNEKSLHWPTYQHDSERSGNFKNVEQIIESYIIQKDFGIAKYRSTLTPTSIRFPFNFGKAYVGDYENGFLALVQLLEKRMPREEFFKLIDNIEKIIGQMNFDGNTKTYCNENQADRKICLWYSNNKLITISLSDYQYKKNIKGADESYAQMLSAYLQKYPSDADKILKLKIENPKEDIVKSKELAIKLTTNLDSVCSLRINNKDYTEMEFTGGKKHIHILDELEDKNEYYVIVRCDTNKQFTEKEIRFNVKLDCPKDKVDKRKKIAEGYLTLNDNIYKIVSSSDINLDDFSINIDLNKDGEIGNLNIPLVTDEYDNITLGDYFYLQKNNEVIKYIGSDKKRSGDALLPEMRFEDLNKVIIATAYDIDEEGKAIATLSFKGRNYKIISESDISLDNFKIKVDMDNSGVIGDYNIRIISSESDEIIKDDIIFILEHGFILYRGTETGRYPLIIFTDGQTGNTLKVPYVVR